LSAIPSWPGTPAWKRPAERDVSSPATRVTGAGPLRAARRDSQYALSAAAAGGKRSAHRSGQTIAEYLPKALLSAEDTRGYCVGG